MDKIAVVVDDVDDRRLFTRLLGVHDYQFFDQCESLCTSRDRFRSTVIVHRGRQQSSIERLPNSCLTSRIIVCSDRTDEDFIVDTLNSGASHYFYFGEAERVLKARIDAALRCHSQHENSILDVEPYTFKIDVGTAFHGERILDLTPREFALAHYLFSNRGRFVSDSELMTGVWTLSPSLSTRRINTLICILKKKMHLNSSQSKWKIERLRSKGYQIRRLSHL